LQTPCQAGLANRKQVVVCELITGFLQHVSGGPLARSARTAPHPHDVPGGEPAG
jgi:hypothetical protein